MKLFWLILLFPLLALSQAPPIQRQIMTTNANPYLEGSGGVTVTSNRANGRWMIDGSGITGSGSTVSSNGAPYIVFTNLNFVGFTLFTNASGDVSIGNSATGGGSNYLFNVNQFAATAGGTNISIKDGVLITNEHHYGLFTNTGSINNSANFTNWGRLVLEPNNSVTKLDPLAPDDGSTSFVLDTSLAKTVGNLFEIKNDGVTQLSLAYNGTLGATFYSSGDILIDGIANTIFNNAWSADSLAYIDSGKILQPFPQGTGALTNNGSGGLGWSTDILNLNSSNSIFSSILTASNNIRLQLDNKVDELNGIATNLNTFGLTNQGPVNFSGLVTNHGAYTGKGQTRIWDNFFVGAAGADLFKVDASIGNLEIIRGVTDYIWPAAHGSGALTNDGAGILGWLPFPTSGGAGVTVSSNTTSSGFISATNLAFFNFPLFTNANGNISIGNTFDIASLNGFGTNINLYGDTIINSNITVTANITPLTPNTKTLALVATNTSGGGRWLSVSPNISRRRWGLYCAAGGSISAINDQAASTGSPANSQAVTNAWPFSTYTTAATANNDVGISAGNVNTYFAGKDCYFSGLFRISQTSTQRCWIGFTSTTLAAINATDTPTTTSTAAIRFSTAAANTNWCFVTCDTSACTVTVGTLTTVTTNRHLIEIREDRANSRWVAYMDSVPLATNAANLPIGSMQPVLSVRTLENVAKSIAFEVFYGEQDNRKDGAIVSYP
jgi:hypothetical protein